MSIESIIETYGYVALFIGTVLEGETILVIAGFAAHRGYLALPWVMAFAFAGSLAGDQLWFYVGRWKGRAFFAARPGWARGADRINALLARYDWLVVLCFRFLYGLRNVTPLALGSSGYSQSLAGRCAVLRLLPLSRSEFVAKLITNIDKSIRKPVVAAPAKRPKHGDLFDTLFRGGYPRIHDKDVNPEKWLGSYYQTYLERDVRDLLNVGDLESFGRFVRLCAGRSGQLLNTSGLAADAGISHTTVKRWLSILEASYIIYFLRPHHRNFNKRLIKSPKLYFLDTGLLCYLLRVQKPADLDTHPARGPIFETWAVSEALKNFYNRGEEPDLFFWRDSAGHEVDLLIDQGTKQIPVEIKSGQTIASDFFADIQYWQKLADQSEGAFGLVYGGDSSYKRQGVTALSWSDWA